MKKNEIMPKYEAGERNCPVCAEPLPAHHIWPGARHRFCGKLECAKVAMTKKHGRYIAANEHQCEGAGCDNFVPEGWYGDRPTYLSCSAECWYRRSLKGNLVRKCACGCGKNVSRPSKRKTVTGLIFFSIEHKGNYLRNKHLDESCGWFRVIVDEYLSGFASLHYRALKEVRNHLCPFFLFLCQQGIASLEDVTTKTITQFLIWAPQSGHRNAAHDISQVSVFFKWAIIRGYRKAGNPVVGLIHHAPRKHRMPRPLSTNELDLMWQLLHERGNARLRLAAAIGEVAGVRIGEICRLRISDVDTVQQTIFVGLPNKTSCERFAFFTEKVKRYFVEWMAERNPSCGHDYLFHNTLGNRLQVRALAEEFKRTLCKTYEGKNIHETGFDSWSTHRLRHTMATRLIRGGADTHTVMGAGGWRSAESMAGYVLVELEVARRGYQEAMQRVKDQKLSAPTRRSLTPAELLMRRQAKATNHQDFRESERCV
jgi:site-specific recombinase XerD